MNVLTRTLKTAWEEVNQPFNLAGGDDFRSYVREVLFPQKDYEPVDKTISYMGEGEGPQDWTGLPDFKFFSKVSGLEFFVEAKFRSHFQDQILEWCKFFQLKRYQELDNLAPVLIAIGVGGRASAPERLFLLPVKHIKFVKLYPGFMQKYELHPGPVSAGHLKRILE